MRALPSYKRQRYFPGSWWSSTVGRHVGYKSFLERDRLILLDFDPGVTGISSQSFWLFRQDGDKGRPVRVIMARPDESPASLANVRTIMAKSAEVAGPVRVKLAYSGLIGAGAVAQSG